MYFITLGVLAQQLKLNSIIFFVEHSDLYCNKPRVSSIAHALKSVMTFDCLKVSVYAQPKCMLLQFVWMKDSCCEYFAKSYLV